MAAEPVAELHGVCLGPDQAPRLRGLDVQVQAGELLALLGPNGAGKSSLLGILSQELRPASGTLRFPGWPQAPEARWLARHRAVLPQQSSLNFAFSAREVISLARTPQATGRACDGEIVDEAMAALDLSGLADKAYTCLSGGERQRVQLARVLAQLWRAQDAEAPRLLLLDEPTAALDLAHQQQLMALLRSRLAQDLAVVVVLHDMNLAAAWADRLLCLHQGKVAFAGRAEAVLTEDNIRRVFACDCVVTAHPQTGRPVILHAA